MVGMYDVELDEKAAQKALDVRILSFEAIDKELSKDKTILSDPR